MKAIFLVPIIQLAAYKRYFSKPFLKTRFQQTLLLDLQRQALQFILYEF